MKSQNVNHWLIVSFKTSYPTRQ